MPKIGVVLAGCGFLDGAEIQEAVFTLLALEKNGAEIISMAPNIDQYHIVNHLTNKPENKQKRNVLEESARIVRGNIKDIKEINPNDLDAVIFPGGFGAAKNLCDFALKGPDCSINPDVENLLTKMIQNKKPIAMVCIAPVITSKIFQKLGIKNIKLTIGTDIDTANALKSLGTQHINCPVKEFVVDEEHKIVSSPAYMLGQNMSEVAEGIEKTVKELIKLI